VLLSMRDLVGGNVVGITADVLGGEIVGIAGITGSGREHVVPLVTGQIPSLGGDISIDGIDIPPYDPRAALQAGGAFVTADRARLGNLTMMSITANTTICDVERNTKSRRLLHPQEREEAQGWMTRLGTKMASLASPIATLSGGNQQKVLFGRGLRLDPKALILDEPTRGIDVGAKEEIHSIIDEAAARGNAVLVASTDTDELVRVCHRVLVLRHGVVVAELVGDEITSERVERAQLQSDPQIQNGTQ
jgi:ribose transport system ATP-binding protein